MSKRIFPCCFALRGNPGKQMLRERLKREALANAERDVAMAAEWFPLEEEASGSRSPRRRRPKTGKTKPL